jgi:orotate phosphoribosyltransferase
VKEVHGIEVKSIFTEEDIPDYKAYAPSVCPMCKEGKHLDAIVNSFGYSKL